MASILLLLAACVGLPYFALSSTGPLLQKWFSRCQPDASAWRLYALSNAGSLLALVTFPFVMEPLVSSPGQTVLWSSAFLVFAGCCGLCAVLAGRKLWPDDRHRLRLRLSDGSADCRGLAWAR